jgi:hypothetical protein
MYNVESRKIVFEAEKSVKIKYQSLLLKKVKLKSKLPMED